MKKTLFFIAFLFAAAFTVQAAAAKVKPPEVVVKAFQQKFPGVTDVDWGREKNGDWEAEFDQQDVDMSANFASDGKWLETETEIKVADLPAAVRSALQGKKVKEAAKILRADGTTVYEAEVKHHDLLFDAQGKAVQ